MKIVGLQTDDAGHVGQNSSAHVAGVVGLQTGAVVVTEARFRLVEIIPNWILLLETNQYIRAKEIFNPFSQKQMLSATPMGIS